MPADMHGHKAEILKRIFAVWIKTPDTRFFDLVLIPFASLKLLEEAAKNDDIMIKAVEDFYAARERDRQKDPDAPKEYL